MPVILDASVTMAWCFEDEATPCAKKVLDLLERDTAAVPSVWPLEVANAVRMSERRGRLEPADAARFSSLLQSLTVDIHEIELSKALGAILRISHDHGLSCYDAAYLELAMREGLPLATADDRLATAARSAGVKLVSF